MVHRHTTNMITIINTWSSHSVTVGKSYLSNMKPWVLANVTCTLTNRHCTTTTTRKTDELTDKFYNTQHKQSSSNHLYNQNLLTQKLHNHINANLLTCVTHHRRWLKTFPQKLTPIAKQKAVDGIACQPYRFSDVNPDGDEHPLCKHWNSSTARREKMLAENSPTAHIALEATNTHSVHILPIIKQTLLQPTQRVRFSPRWHSW